MKTNILSILAAGAVVLGAASCSENWNPPTSTEGSVDLGSLTVDTDEMMKVVESGSRAADDVDLDNFEVTITNLKDESVAGSWKYASKPEIVTLPVGQYRVDVESHEVQPAEWDKPYYAGSKEFAIENGKIAMLGEVTAYFKSVKVTVIFDEELRKHLGDDVTVDITAGEASTAKLTFTPSTTSAGYFKHIPGSMTMVAELNGTIDGVKSSDRRTFTTVEAGQHHILTYTLKDGPIPPQQTGTIDGSGIQLDLSVTTVNVSENVVVSENNIPLEPNDRPTEEPEEPENPDVPDVPVDPQAPITFDLGDSANLKLNEAMPLTAASAPSFGKAAVNITAPKGIEKLMVNIVCDGELDAVLKSMFPVVDGVVTFDLAHPGDLEETLKGLGLAAGAEVLGQTAVPFDISNFIWDASIDTSLLGLYSGKDTFTITVTDSEGNTASTSLIFDVK